MDHEAGSDVAELNHMFVSEDGRGHDIRRLLLEAMFEHLIANGYRKVSKNPFRKIISLFRWMSELVSSRFRSSGRFLLGTGLRDWSLGPTKGRAEATVV